MRDKSLYGGYLVFTPQGGGQVYRVPFAGFKGDYQSIQVLVPTANNFPRLARLTSCPFNGAGILRGSECFGGGLYSFAAAGAVFTLVPGLNQTPFVLAHLDHQARRLRVEVFRVSDDRNMGQAMNLEHLARSSTAAAFFALPWDGNVTKGNARRRRRTDLLLQVDPDEGTRRLFDGGDLDVSELRDRPAVVRLSNTLQREGRVNPALSLFDGRRLRVAAAET